MPVKVKITFNAHPRSVWAKLAEKLGREPTNQEAAAEVKRIIHSSKGENET